jgi:hypothetical protein
VAGVFDLTNTCNNNASATSSSTSATNSNGTADLSQAGQFFSKLESLARNSPSEFEIENEI